MMFFTQKDTFDLWDTIVSSKLLAQSDIILFLNKYDILGQKLKSGINFASYVTSYKDRNTVEAVGKYLHRKFMGIHQQRSSNSKRVLHAHCTSVTVSGKRGLGLSFRSSSLSRLFKDKTSTQKLLNHCMSRFLVPFWCFEFTRWISSAVREVVLRTHFKQIMLL